MSNEREPTVHGADPLPEGEEQPPPGTRTMAIVRWTLVGIMAVAAASAWVYHAASSGALVDVQRFHCPMHPSVVMTHKGECPVCGMDLVPVAAPAQPGAAQEPPAAAAAAVPVHQVAPASTARPLYVCPMGCVPGFETPDPNARCPKCGMKLTPKEAREGMDAAPDAHAGVPGLAPVELSADRVQLIGMRTATARREPLAPTLRTAGVVAASEAGVVSVNSRFACWIEALAVSQTGQLVEKGQVLARIYSPDAINAQQAFLSAVRWSDRRGDGAAATPPGLSDPEREARQRLELLGVAREDADAIAASGRVQQAVAVRAPVRGYVARKSALRGVYVQPGSELFQLADLSTVWVIADVYESDIGRVREGQRATLELAAYPGERFTGSVQFLYPALNTGSRTLQARVALKNPGLRLRPGMSGDVTLELGAADAVVVPREALVDTGELQYVFVARGGGRFEPRRVKAGAQHAGKVAIVEGLHEGEEVVTTANFLLDSESRLHAAVGGVQP